METIMTAMSWGIVTGLPLMLVGLPILISVPFGLPTAIGFIRMAIRF